MNLYAINAEIEKILNNDIVDAETGEILDEDLFEKLDRLEEDQSIKMENIACFIKNLLSDAEQLNAEEKALMERRKVKENKAKRLTRYLEDNMLRFEKEKFETPKCVITFRKSKKVVVTNEKQFCEKFPIYEKEKITKSIDKVGIRKALKDGADFNGLAKMQTFKNINIK